MSERGFSLALTILTDPAPLNDMSKLMPIEVCDKAIVMIDEQLGKPTSAKEATRFADLLLGQMPSVVSHNAKVYYNAIVAIFAAYPFELCRQAVDPVGGVLNGLEFALKPSDLKRFLDARTDKLKLAKINAGKHKALWANRLKANREDEKWEQERQRFTPEERARRAQAILRGERP
jgi:hypothetical protein